jgi:hypothetical protein
MKIIILKGDKNKGKITTMGMVFVALHIKGGKVINFNHLKTPSGMDFEAVFDYPCEGKPLKVAIYSKGDNIDDCNDAIRRYSPSMNVLIIAYSTKQTDLNIPTGDKSVPVPKTVASSAIPEVKANTKDCRKIISLI